MTTDDGVLNVVEHIEGELQRLMRLVATLRRRIEASSGSAPVVHAAPAGSVPGLHPALRGSPTQDGLRDTASAHPAPPAIASMHRNQMRASNPRMPATREEFDIPHVTEEGGALKTTVANGSGYGFVQPRSTTRRSRSEEPGIEGATDDDPFERKAR